MRWRNTFINLLMFLLWFFVCKWTYSNDWKLMSSTWQGHVWCLVKLFSSVQILIFFPYTTFHPLFYALWIYFQHKVIISNMDSKQQGEHCINMYKKIFCIFWMFFFLTIFFEYVYTILFCCCPNFTTSDKAMLSWISI